MKNHRAKRPHKNVNGTIFCFKNLTGNDIAHQHTGSHRNMNILYV